MGPEFFQTKMGTRFYESTAPQAAKALNRIADALERIAGSLEQTKTEQAVSRDEAIPRFE